MEAEDDYRYICCENEATMWGENDNGIAVLLRQGLVEDAYLLAGAKYDDDIESISNGTAKDYEELKHAIIVGGYRLLAELDAI